MIERTIILEQADPAVFFGVNNENIQLIKSLFPRLKILARGNAIKAVGNADDIASFEEKINQLEAFCVQTNRLSSDDISAMVVKGEERRLTKQDNLIIFGINGKPIVGRTPNQQKFVKKFDENDLLFGVGPAGSGKTYTAIALAVRAFKNKEVRKIILSRPAVEAGEKLGFLPGDMKEKIDPYLQPLYDALEDMIPPAKLREYMENQIIQIAPLAFMRGRTLNDAVIILDEAQNTSVPQIKMFLTRLGMNAKMIVTGDMTQIDLPPAQQSGLKHALRLLKDIEGVGVVEFQKSDIVRHRLVQRIVEAYERDDENIRHRQSDKKDTPVKS